MKTHDVCDVLIVGGGPAGSNCARHLHAAGLDVVVMDKAEFPRDKVCAGWITPAVVATLDLDTEDYRRHRVLQPLRGFRTGCIGGDTVDTRYDAPVSYGIRRIEFDDYLLARSRARLRLGEAVRSISRSGDGWWVNDNLHASLLVGAGGHFCPVARFIGARPGSDEPTVAAQEIEFELTPAQAARCLVREDRPELYFCRDMKGYGWCFRKGDYLNIGLGREDSHRLTGHVREFVDWLKAGGRIPRDILERFHGHAYLLYPHAPRRLAGDGVLLIGDAAGLAYPQSGEGILPAVESGQMAAETIIAAAGDTRRDALHAYVRRIGERFGPRDAARTEAPPLIQQLKQQLARTLLTSHWFARHIVVERWFLHTHQPPLLHSPVRQH